MNEAAKNNQVTGNIGLFYVCYRLSCLGWNVMPTARNARGVDVLIYSQDAKRKLGLQVKALSERNPVPLGRDLHSLGDFVVICRNLKKEQPECFILAPAEIREGVRGKTSFWLKKKHYEQDRFREKWERIGRGDTRI